MVQWPIFLVDLPPTQTLSHGLCHLNVIIYHFGALADMIDAVNLFSTSSTPPVYNTAFLLKAFCLQAMADNQKAWWHHQGYFLQLWKPLSRATEFIQCCHKLRTMLNWSECANQEIAVNKSKHIAYLVVSIKILIWQQLCVTYRAWVACTMAVYHHWWQTLWSKLGGKWQDEVSARGSVWAIQSCETG